MNKLTIIIIILTQRTPVESDEKKKNHNLYIKMPVLHHKMSKLGFCGPKPAETVCGLVWYLFIAILSTIFRSFFLIPALVIQEIQAMSGISLTTIGTTLYTLLHQLPTALSLRPEYKFQVLASSSLPLEILRLSRYI